LSPLSLKDQVVNIASLCVSQGEAGLLSFATYDQATYEGSLERMNEDRAMKDASNYAYVRSVEMSECVVGSTHSNNGAGPHWYCTKEWAASMEAATSGEEEKGCSGTAVEGDCPLRFMAQMVTGNPAHVTSEQGLRSSNRALCDLTAGVDIQMHK
jgi:hypothetical protein